MPLPRAHSHRRIARGLAGIARPASRLRAAPDYRFASSIISATGTKRSRNGAGPRISRIGRALYARQFAACRRKHRFELITGGDRLEAGIADFKMGLRRSWKDAEPFPDFNAGLMRNSRRLGFCGLASCASVHRRLRHSCGWLNGIAQLC